MRASFHPLSLCLCASAALSLGCPGRPKRVVYDLARLAAVADRSGTRDVVVFGTPPAEPQLVDGFYREAHATEGERFAWAKAEAEIALDWPDVRNRAAVVEMAPYRGVKNQTAEVRLNGNAVGHFALGDYRQRYKIALPASAQKAGANRLRFLFGGTASPSQDPGNLDKRQLSASFYSLTVGDEADPSLDDLLRRDAPRPFSTTLEQGVPGLAQIGSSAVRYAVRLPERAELRFATELHPLARTAAGAATFRVTLEDTPGKEKELWRGPPSKEISVSLPGRAGDVVSVGLHVEGARFAWGIWRAPRIMGADGEAASPSAETERRRTELRKALDGVNVMLVVLDAAGAGHFGCYGYGRPTTPEIDRIAADGVLFERASTPAVYTLGAMSSLWTSQYPDRHHAEVSYADRLPRSRLTLAEALSLGGIHSAGFVANAVAGAAFGFDRGFAEFHEVYRRFPDLGSRGEAMTRVLPEWLGAQKGRRFFAYVHFREPHFPYDPMPPFDTRFGPDTPLSRDQRRDKTWYTDVNQARTSPTPAQIEHLVRLYDGNLASVDREVGRLRQALEQAGLWDRTLLVITADHGEQLYEHGYISHSAQVHQESVHVPLIVRFPAGKGPRAQRVAELVDLLDLGPTILDVFGLSSSGQAAKVFQGRSLLSVLGGAPGKNAMLSRTVWERPVYAYGDGRLKLIHDTRTGVSHLFDVVRDPREMQPLESQEPIRTAYLRQGLLSLVEQLERAPRAAPAGEAPATPTRDQCENLKALGYVAEGCP